jgi:hypothetical protein
MIDAKGAPVDGFDEPAFIALVWIAVPLVAFNVLRVETVSAYWLVALPGPWVVAVWLFAPSRSKGAILPKASVWAGALAVLCIAMGIVYLVDYHAMLSAPKPSLVVYPSYRDQRDAMRFVCTDSAGERVWITQEARSLEAGLDYQLNYLLAMIEGNTTRFAPDGPPPTRRYLLHNRANPLPPELRQQLARWRTHTFGLMQVYWKSAENL